MRSNPSLFPLVAGGLTAFALVSAVFVSSDFAAAADATASAPSASCSCPNSGAQTSSKPKFARLAGPLDESDEIAALESVQYALSEVADGSSYIWHRSNGRLSGVVKPLASFKDKRGGVCRHILVVLNSTDLTKKTEAVACRLTTGVWQLEG
jgi:surface antigen